jgi:hypothetical protein
MPENKLLKTGTCIIDIFYRIQWLKIHSIEDCCFFVYRGYCNFFAHVHFNFSYYSVEQQTRYKYAY